MLATFVASAVVQSTTNDLKDTNMSLKGDIHIPQESEVQVYDNVVLRDESMTNVSEIYRHFGLNLEFVIPI